MRAPRVSATKQPPEAAAQGVEAMLLPGPRHIPLLRGAVGVSCLHLEGGQRVQETAPLWRNKDLESPTPGAGALGLLGLDTQPHLEPSISCHLHLKATAGQKQRGNSCLWGGQAGGQAVTSKAWRWVGMLRKTC